MHKQTQIQRFLNSLHHDVGLLVTGKTVPTAEVEIFATLLNKYTGGFTARQLHKKTSAKRRVSW